jgi:adenosylcobinamide-GDP ribazoletransferase
LLCRCPQAISARALPTAHCPLPTVSMGLIVALGFLTALPVPRGGATSPGALARSAAFFPIVGLIVGALLLGLDLVLTRVLPGGVRGVMLAITRGLHLDGLMDCCDGLFGGFTPERRLAIMRDSRVGAFGVLGAIVVLLLRYSGVAALDGSWRALGLLLPPVMGRWAMVLAMVAYPYGRAEGLGLAFKQAASWRQVVLATIAAAILGAGLWWPWGGLGLLAAALVTALVARFMLRRLPGLTGDCYGAINEIVEGLVLLVIIGAHTISGGQ